MKKADKENFAELRRRALQVLDDYHKTDPDVFNGNIRKLIVELDTNRIELELQNEDLRIAQEELERSSQKYNQLYEFAPVGYLRLSTEGHIIEVNLRAAEMLKVDRAKLIDQKFASFIDYYDQDIFYLHNQKLRASGTRQSCRLSLRTGDNSHLPVQLESIITSGHHDLSTLTLVAMADISEIEEARKEISDINNNLELRVEKRSIELQKVQNQLLHKEKLAAIGTLAASIAHELNNPLQGVLNVIQGVGRRASFEPEDAELIEIAANECRRMRDLLKALQDFDRPTSGIRAPFDVHSTIDSVLLLFKKRFDQENIRVDKQYGQQTPILYAVADQIKQVIMNILANALTACEAGGLITIETDTDQGSLVLSITDNGVGIEPAHLDRIFDPFFSTKSAVKGIGLGLSVSYGIIKKHKGSIEVNSSVGKGSTFRLKLPLRMSER